MKHNKTYALTDLFHFCTFLNVSKSCKVKLLCLSVLSVEDIEDVYLFGLMITGFLLIGFCIFLVYQQILKTRAAVHGPQRLPLMIFEVGKAVGTQTVAISELRAELSHLKAELPDLTPDVDVTLEKLSALQRNMDRSGDQYGHSG